MQYDITSTLMLGLTGRGHYDAKYELDGGVASDGAWGAGIDDEDLRAGPQGEYTEADVDLREYYLTWYAGDFKIKTGRQQLVWSEADAIRIVDIINPIDRSRDYTTTCYSLDWEDVRIPTRMMNIVYTAPESEHQYEIEGVIIPEDFQANTSAAYGETFYLIPNNTDFSVAPFDKVCYAMGMFTSGYPLGYGSPAQIAANQLTHKSFYEALNDDIKDAYDTAQGDFQGAARLRGVFGGWDFHLFYVHQRVQDPIITASTYFPAALAIPDFIYNNPALMTPDGFHQGFPFDGTRDDFGVKVHFPRVNTIGGTFNYFSTSLATVFRGEGSYTINQPFTGLRQGVADLSEYGIPGVSGLGAWEGWFDDEIHYKDVVHYLIGFDRPTWITFLNETNTFFITGQFYHKVILNYDDTNHDDVSTVNANSHNPPVQLSTMMGKDSESDHQYLFSLKMNTKYADDTINPDVLAVWDVNAHAGFIKPEVAWNPNYNTMFEIGMLYVTGDNYMAGPFGYVKDSDLVYAVMEYKW